MPTLTLLVGPNAAGKATFINGFLQERAPRAALAVKIAFGAAGSPDLAPLVGG